MPHTSVRPPRRPVERLRSRVDKAGAAVIVRNFQPGTACPRGPEGKGTMEKREEQQILSLIDQVPELRGLYEEHVDLKKRLEKLNHKLHLTIEEEVEKKRLQKLKLAGKDRMMMLLAQHEAPESKTQIRAS
jgi:uncharacterized protein